MPKKTPKKKKPEKLPKEFDDTLKRMLDKPPAKRKKKR